MTFLMRIFVCYSLRDIGLSTPFTQTVFMSPIISVNALAACMNIYLCVMHNYIQYVSTSDPH